MCGFYYYRVREQEASVRGGTRPTHYVWGVEDGASISRRAVALLVLTLPPVKGHVILIILSLLILYIISEYQSSDRSCTLFFYMLFWMNDLQTTGVWRLFAERQLELAGWGIFVTSLAGSRPISEKVYIL